MAELSLTECSLCQFTPKYLSSVIAKGRLPVPESANTDVSFKSADGKVFYLQKKYLEFNTGGFPYAEFNTQDGEPIQLPESSMVLEALFRFTYPIIQPDLEDTSFEVVAAVADAAEKYVVFSAMNFCRLRMRRFLPEHAVEVLGYAAKHDHDNIIEEAIPFSVRLPLVQVFDRLPPCLFRPWIQYQEAWKVPFDNAFQFLVLLGPSLGSSRGGKVMIPPCYACGITLFIMVIELQALRSLDELKEALAKPRERARSCVFPDGTCGYHMVVNQITTDIAIGIKNVPPFQSFLRGD